MNVFMLSNERGTLKVWDRNNCLGNMFYYTLIIRDDFFFNIRKLDVKVVI